MSFGGLLEKLLLRESASPEQICKAIDNHSYVIINYNSEEGRGNGSRIIMPVAYGLSSKSNPVVRAYQPIGDTASVLNKWKTFRIDRISYWEETKKRFEKNDFPIHIFQEFNPEGDNSMSVVNKIINFDTELNATNGVNLGPKTKEKVDATIQSQTPQTDGERILNIGRRNIQNQQANIKVDLDNNRKANAVFNILTNNNPIASGPREPGQDDKPRNVSGTPERDDINPNELEDLRQQVQNIDRSDMLNNDDIWNDNTQQSEDWENDMWDPNSYQHQWDDDEIDQADFDQRVMNRELWQNKDLSTNRRKYDRYQNSLDSADRMFKNRKDSGNRILYNMEHEDEYID